MYLIYHDMISAGCLAARSMPAGGLLLEAEWSTCSAVWVVMVAFLDMTGFPSRVLPVTPPD